jgi:hypothetical protein
LTSLPNVFSGNIAYNNLFYNSASPDFSRFPTHDYNTFINSGGAHSETNGTTATSGDPFVDFANLNFALKAATTVGKALPAPYTFDPIGAMRGADGVWDRGAFEFVSGAPPPPPPSGSACDVNSDGTTNVVDVQQEVNQALGIATCKADINKDGQCTVVDVQRVVNAALGGQCVSP